MVVKGVYLANHVRSSGVTVFLAFAIILLSSFLFSMAMSGLSVGRILMGGR